MREFRVWAPAPEAVSVRLEGRDTPMHQEADGWWRLPFDAHCCVDYQFVIDGQAVPDPRSPFQPYGIHGPSRTVAHEAFQWSDTKWQALPLAEAVVYELHVGTFTPEGTFASAISRLEHLKSLGITHVELMPVNEFSGSRGWGYDGVDLFAPHHAWGGPDELKRLVNACHEHGLAVILDVVYNHLGPTGNYLAKFGPYFTERYVTPWGPAVNLDGRGSDEVRRFICDNAEMWLRDYRFDGLRVDAVHALLDTSALHILEQLAERVEQVSAELGRPLVLIAESDLNDPRVVRSRELGGYGLDAQWSDDFHHALHVALTGESRGYYADFGGLSTLAHAFEKTFVYAGSYSPTRGRRHGRSPEGIEQWRFLGYLQNHDQVGNRAAGERSSHLMNAARLKAAAALLLTSPFTPMLFQGEEWGASTPFLYFTGHEEQWLAEAVAKGRAEEFSAFEWKPEDVPNPQDVSTFEASRLKWDELSQEPHRTLLEWHRDLIGLRRRFLRGDKMATVQARFDPAENWFQLENGPLLTACNLSPETRALQLPNMAAELAELLLSSDKATALCGSTIFLAPEATAVLRIH